MTVRETQLSSEQKSKEAALQAEGEVEFASKLAQSMDLPSTLTESVNDHAKAVENPKEEVEEEVEDEEEEVPQAEGDSEEEALEEEDLIPKSKVQKRFDEQTKTIKNLQKEIEAMKKEREVAPKDDQQAQLEKMSESELKATKRQVMALWKSESDPVKAEQYLDLSEKIDNVIRTAPQRFQSTQISRFNDAVQETASSLDGFDSVKQEIFSLAKSIYDASPELQGSVSGQERAWKFAVDHFTALKKASEGKSETTELKRQVNTLKRKISVDTSSKKAVAQPDTTQKLYRKALVGNDNDKATYLKKRLNVDGLLSDDEVRNLESIRR